MVGLLDSMELAHDLLYRLPNEQANDFHTHSELTFSAYEFARSRNINKRVGVEKARREMN
jgi:hypothetical protein